MDCFGQSEPDLVLPEQSTYCSHRNAMCGYVKKKVGYQRYDKRLAVISHDGYLILYRFYLYGVSTGVPLIGKIYDLKQPRSAKVSSDGDDNIICLKLADGRNLKLKLKGPDSNLWISRIVHLNFTEPSHVTGGCKGSTKKNTNTPENPPQPSKCRVPSCGRDIEGGLCHHSTGDATIIRSQFS